MPRPSRKSAASLPDSREIIDAVPELVPEYAEEIIRNEAAEEAPLRVNDRDRLQAVLDRQSRYFAVRRAGPYRHCSPSLNQPYRSTGREAEQRGNWNYANQMPMAIHHKKHRRLAIDVRASDALDSLANRAVLRDRPQSGAHRPSCCTHVTLRAWDAPQRARTNPLHDSCCVRRT